MFAYPRDASRHRSLPWGAPPSSPLASTARAVRGRRHCTGSSRQYHEPFQRVYAERYQKRYGFWRPVIADAITRYLTCGDLRQGFARVRCPDCGHELFVAFSCRRRCLCPSCHQPEYLEHRRLERLQTQRAAPHA